MDINQSIAFINGKGSNLEKARLNSILYGTSPQPDVIEEFIDLQNTDGGFPFGMTSGNLSTINETTVALWWMEELNMLSSAHARKAFAYLLTTQKEDGSWDEDPLISQYDLPPWAQVGDLKTRLYMSAYAAYWLAVGGYSHLSAFRKALNFLLKHQEKSGMFYGYLHTTWIATGVFLLAGERYAHIADIGIQAFSSEALVEWEDSQIAWALDCLSKGELPKNHPLIETGLAELLKRQKSDGSWASEDGEAFAVGATIQALKVLKRYEMVNIVQAG